MSTKVDERTIVRGPSKWHLQDALFHRAPKLSMVVFHYMPRNEDNPNAVDISMTVTSVQALEDEHWNVEGVAQVMPIHGVDMTGPAAQKRRVAILDYSPDFPVGAILKFLP